MAVLLVRRGLGSLYYTSLRAFAASRNVEVVIDRRKGDRRQPGPPKPGDRRQTDRRGAPPPTWDRADFVVLPEETVAAPDAADMAAQGRVEEAEESADEPVGR
jgi:hypothetical protein